MEIIIDTAFNIETNIASEEEIEKYLNKIITDEYKSSVPVYVSVLITNNEEIHQINREYREIDSPTDVISFAYHDSEEMQGGMDALGDIIISIEKIEEQASDYGHSIKREFYYVLTHGILHLLGYDHIEENDKEIMRKKEEEILGSCGIGRD